MKNFKYIVVIVLLVISHVGYTAAKVDSWMLTDRTIYVSGENLLSKIYTSPKQNLKLVYLTLSSVNGELISSVNLNVENNQASGSLYLPDSLSTGSFFVNVYSSHLIKQALFCTKIFVVNRFENTDELQTIKRADLPEVNFNEEQKIRVSGLASSCKKRENIALSIQVDESLLSELTAGLSVNVAENMAGFEPQYCPLTANCQETSLLSEHKGVIMEGVVKNFETGEVCSGATVFLSKPDSIPYFDYYRTGTNGRFYFLLKDFYGNVPLVVQAVKENELLKVELEENQFPNLPLVTTKQTELTPQIKAYFEKAVSLVTYKKIYNIEELKFDSSEYIPVYPFPFYGENGLKIDPDLYVELSDFNEISKELIAPVRFRVQKDAYTIRMLDREQARFFDGTPFITIDGVPIQKVSKIAGMGSKNIDWIDVIPYQCFYGEMTFDGVLAIYTKERDASRILSTDQRLKLNYETLQEDVLYANHPGHKSLFPDFRQVLLWKPHLKPEKQMTLNFTTSDIKGNFKLTITGRKKDGEIVQVNHNFTVK